MVRWKSWVVALTAPVPMFVWAGAANAQTAATSTVFGGFLVSIESAVATSIVAPIASLLTYVAAPAGGLAAIAVTVFAILVMLGRITAPGSAVTLAIRIGVIGLLLGGSGFYQQWVVQPMLVGNGGAWDDLVTAVGGTTGVNVIDVVWAQMAQTLSTLSGMVGLSRTGIAAVALMLTVLVIGLVCCAVAFLEAAIITVGMAMVLMVGPFMICFAMFDSTRRWAWAWAGEVVHYGLAYVLLAVAATLASSINQYWIAKVAAKNIGTFQDLLVFAMWGGLGAIMTLFFFLQARKIAGALAGGGSASSGLQLIVGTTLARI
jgi:hypothetical protein